MCTVNRQCISVIKMSLNGMALYPRCTALNCASGSLVLEVDDDEQLGEEDYVDEV